jgi:methylated-DNA-[protein]-cysteine S-methyltransferase
MEQISIQYHKTAVGELILGSFNDKLCLTDWRYRRMRSTVDKRLQKAFDATYVEEKTDVIEQTVLQLSEYFEGTRTEFDIPLNLADTDFQK